MAEPMTLTQLRQHLAMTRDSEELPRHERDYAGHLLHSIDAAVFVPGLWHCEKCNFNLVLKNLHARTGAVTARTGPGEACPNCNTALERVTYQASYNEQQERFEKYLMDAAAKREALEAVMRESYDYIPGELDFTAPGRIWLQIDTTGDNHDRSEQWPGPDGVTWQDESLGGQEIQYVRADLVAAADGGMAPESWNLMSLPSRFQLSQPVRSASSKGSITAVTFTLVDGIGKVFYDIATKFGPLHRVPSDDVQPASVSHLRAVPDEEGAAHE